MLGPAPSASGEPSIWYADVAAPHKKSSGKDRESVIGGELQASGRRCGSQPARLYRKQPSPARGPREEAGAGGRSSVGPVGNRALHYQFFPQWLIESGHGVVTSLSCDSGDDRVAERGKGVRPTLEYETPSYLLH